MAAGWPVLSARTPGRRRSTAGETGTIVSADAGFLELAGRHVDHSGTANFSEATLAPRKDGTILMAIRTQGL